MIDGSERPGEPTARARLWIGIIVGLMRAASRDLGPDCPVGRRLAEGAEEAAALLAAPRPRLTLVHAEPAPEIPEARPLSARAAATLSARRARRRTTSPG
jgi:hypothetical protein